MIKIIRVDEIIKCFKCGGVGFVDIPDSNLIERIEEKCNQCNGSGLLKITGNLEVSPKPSYNEILACHDSKE